MVGVNKSYCAYRGGGEVGPVRVGYSTYLAVYRYELALVFRDESTLRGGVDVF